MDQASVGLGWKERGGVVLPQCQPQLCFKDASSLGIGSTEYWNLSVSGPAVLASLGFSFFLSNVDKIARSNAVHL